MLEPAVIVLRLVQYGGAMVLFGSSLFLLYALPRGEARLAKGWGRRLLAGGAAALLFGTVVGLLAQTSVVAGSIGEGLKLSSLSAVFTSMSMGPSSLVRSLAAALALGLLLSLKSGRVLWVSCALLGAVACGSFAWMGHGAATEGSGWLLHLGADIVHTLAAALWGGALAAFVMMTRRSERREESDLKTLHRALHGFSGVGSVAVAAILATGLVNSWFLVGPSRLDGLLTTPYGRLLSLKLLLFCAMLALAAANRFRLTPSLGRALETGANIDQSVDQLRQSLLWETGAAVLILALVAWLGALAPVSAQ